MDIFDSPFLTKKIYRVSELNRETKNLLSNHFLTVQVEGELSNLSSPSSGHIYFSLKDKCAQVRCAMFKSQQRRLGFKPENGKQVIISAQVGLYEARGDYQLLVEKMQQAGVGDLQRAFDQLKSKLMEEGLFEQHLKQSIPEIPQKIAVITSPTGAAIHDVLSVLKRRFPTVPIIIYPTSVQGEKAKLEIVKAIKTANQQKKVGVILLVRGGGSIEDLWAFNEECVARAIAKSKIPIVSGIGHEVDFTMADFVADLRAPTPSVAAESAVPNKEDWLTQFRTTEYELQKITLRRLLSFQQTTEWLNKRLFQQHPRQQLQRYAQTLDNVELRLLQSVKNKIDQHKSELENLRNSLQYNNSHIKILRYREKKNYLSIRLNKAMQYKFESLKRKQYVLIQTLNAISPLATLERGYAIVSDSQKSTIITSIKHLSINDTIKTRFLEGEIISQIKEINDA